jgi:hypothetical protein
MAKPLTATVSHTLGRQEAKRRIARGLDETRPTLLRYVGALEERWEGDCLLFRGTALGQAVAGRLEVLDDLVCIEVDLPPVLNLLAGTIAGRLRREGNRMLEKP